MMTLLVFLALEGAAAANDTPRVRRFELTYRAEVNVPGGARRLDLWLPFPQTNANQDIELLSLTSPHPTRHYRDREYGNTIVHLRAEGAGGTTVAVEMKFRVDRREYVRRDFPAGITNAAAADPALTRWLSPDRLVPLDSYVTRLARKVVQGRSSVLERARAIYDYTVDNLRYDKSGTGWGNGDIYYACDAKRGNCTDFHAVFIGFARALGIPAKFAIGFPLPPERGEGEIAGYHCWAEFYLPGYGFVPVDTSEANKNPDRREYFFGAHDENRVEFTVGRDIVLEPPASGPPLNYFIYPYAEADGRPVQEIRKRFFFQDLPEKPR
jgi:transglutaminase-like putative cysteine protease